MPNPNCATAHEWQDLVVPGMTIGVVREVVDFTGIPGPTKAGQYSYDWVCCQTWQPGKSCRGWFDNVHDVLLSKNIVVP